MRVFKFRSLDDKSYPYVLRLATAGECYFAPPASLNDPFEYAAQLRFDHAPIEHRVAFWTNFPPFRERATGLDQTALLKILEEFEQPEISMTEAVYQNRSQGIFCTCESWDNRVFWGHYADNHRGVAVEIETDGIEILSRPQRVLYRDTVPELNFYAPTLFEKVIEVCSTKHSDWAYEREIRFFCSAGLHLIPVSNVVGIHIGMDCFRNYNDRIAELLSLARKANPQLKAWVLGCDRSTGKLFEIPEDKDAQIAANILG
jgi:hypothetical protein